LLQRGWLLSQAEHFVIARYQVEMNLVRFAVEHGVAQFGPQAEHLVLVLLTRLCQVCTRHLVMLLLLLVELLVVQIGQVVQLKHNGRNRFVIMSQSAYQIDYVPQSSTGRVGIRCIC
jgi:hypothetical protein